MVNYSNRNAIGMIIGTRMIQRLLNDEDTKNRLTIPFYQRQFFVEVTVGPVIHRTRQDGLVNIHGKRSRNARGRTSGRNSAAMRK